MPKGRVLVIDDALEMANAVVEYLQRHGFEAEGVGSRSAAAPGADRPLSRSRDRRTGDDVADRAADPLDSSGVSARWSVRAPILRPIASPTRVEVR